MINNVARQATLRLHPPYIRLVCVTYPKELGRQHYWFLLVLFGLCIALLFYSGLARFR